MWVPNAPLYAYGYIRSLHVRMPYYMLSFSSYICFWYIITVYHDFFIFQPRPNVENDIPLHYQFKRLKGKTSFIFWIDFFHNIVCLTTRYREYTPTRLLLVMYELYYLNPTRSCFVVDVHRAWIFSNLKSFSRHNTVLMYRFYKTCVEEIGMINWEIQYKLSNT